MDLAPAIDLDRKVERRIAQHLTAAGVLTGAGLSRASGIGASRLYPALARLEEAGVIQGEWLPDTYPRRRVYSLTDLGKQATSHLPPVRYPPNPSPIARLGRWLADLLMRPWSG